MKPKSLRVMACAAAMLCLALVLSGCTNLLQALMSARIYHPRYFCVSSVYG